MVAWSTHYPAAVKLTPSPPAVLITATARMGRSGNLRLPVFGTGFGIF